MKKHTVYINRTEYYTMAECVDCEYSEHVDPEWKLSFSDTRALKFYDMKHKVEVLWSLIGENKEPYAERKS